MANRFYGIEVELEQAEAPTAYPPDYWSREGDGSLRNRGMEYKSIEPLLIDDAINSLTILDAYFARYGVHPEANARCSIHIHMDARDMSSMQIYNLLCNYSMIEPMLFSYIGQERGDSHFCVPYYHCKGVARDLMLAVKEHEPMMIRDVALKYMALNLTPLHTFGSIEWRHFPAVLPVSEAAKWIEIVDSMKTESMEGLWSDAQAMEWARDWLPGAYDEDLYDSGLETYYYHMLGSPPESPRRRVQRHRAEIDWGLFEGDEPEEEEEEDFPDLDVEQQIARAREIIRRLHPLQEEGGEV